MPRILIHQEVDAEGRVALAEYSKEFAPTMVNRLTLQPVYRFLFSLNVASTSTPNLYRYLDPLQGGGTMQPEGFDDGDVVQIAEYVRVRDRDRAIGIIEPTRWDDKQASFGGPRAFRNPIIMVAIAAALIIFAVAIVPWTLALEAADPSRDDSIVVIVMVFSLILVIMGGFLLWQHGRRVRWWLASRAFIRAQGYPMPEDLHLLS